MKSILGMKRLFFFLFIHILFFQANDSKAQTTLFSEDFSSNSFNTNGWTFSPSQSNWTINTAYPPGSIVDTPHARFFWTPIVIDYEFSLVSPIIQSAGYNNLTLSYKLHYEKYTGTIPNPTQEEFKVEYKAAGATNWIQLNGYDNNNSTANSISYTVTNQALTGVTSGNIQIRFRATGDNSFNIQAWTVDNIVVKGTLLPACSGAPTVTISSNTYNYCATATTNPILTATPGSNNSGYTYQWQSRLACSNSAFTDITGATSANYVVPAITTAKDYRAKITCSGSNQSAYSGMVNIYPACYCESEAQNSTGADIGYLYINSVGIFSNPATAPATYVNNSSANKQYTDYSYTTPIQFNPGSSNNFYVTQINSTATQTPAYLKMYVDFNRDGDFTDFGEQINTGSLSTSTPTVTTFTGTLNITSSATPGYTKMRLVMVENGNATTVNSCLNNYSKGETEDYTVLIRPSTIFSVSASNTGPYCLSTTSAIQLNASVAGGSTCHYFSWTGPNNFTSNSQNPTISSPTTANLGNYSVTVTSYGGITASSSTSVSQVVSPVISSVTPQNPTSCTATNGSLILIGLTPNTAYTVSYTFNSTPVTTSITSNSSGNIVINNLGAGTYTNITVSQGGCASSTVGPYTLAGPLANAPTAWNSGNTCVGNSLTLYASAIANATYNWTGPGGFTSNQQNPTITTTTGINSGTYYVTATVNGCTSTAANTAVTIYAIPVITAVSIQNPTGCGYFNGSFTIQGLTPNSQYIVSYARNSIAQTPDTTISTATGTITISGLNWGFYNAINVTLNGCTSASFPGVNLVDPAPPAQLNGTTNAPICTGVNLILNSNFVNNGTYSWTGPGGYSSSLQNPPAITNATSANAGNYYVTVTVNNCTSIPDTVSVVINSAPPPPTMNYNAPACVGATLQLTAGTVPSATYHWSGPNGFSSTLQNPSFSNATLPLTGTYNLYTIANGCQSTTGSLIVEVHSVPAKPIVVNDTICQFATVPPFNVAGNNLLWYNSPSAINGSPNAPNLSSNNTGTFTWYVTQTDSGCQSLKQPISLVVKPTPPPPTVNPPVVLYCQYNTATQLTASGQNLMWYSSPSGGVGSSIAPLPNTTNLGTSTFYVSQSLNGCESNRTTISYTVLAKPDTPKVNNPFQFCVGQTNAFVSAQGSQLKWYTSPTSTNSSPTPPTINTNTAGTTVYYVTQTAGNNCESDRARVEVIVHENVHANISISQQLICQFDTINISNISVSPPNPSTANYHWNFDGGVVITGTGAGPYQIRWDIPGHKTVKVDIDNFNCVDNDADTVFVKESPLGEFELKKDACIDEVMYVQAAWNSMNATDYYWDFTNAVVMNQAFGPGAYKIRFTTPGLHFITLKTHINGCYSWPHKDTINIHDFPFAKIEPLNMSKICKEDSIHFKMQGAVYQNYTYNWSPAEFFPFNGLPEVNAIIRRGPEWIKLNVIDPYGCVGTDSMYLNVENCCFVSLPDAFTPNNDGRNDIFRIISRGSQAISVFRIVNRWGQTVFETASPDMGWDGTTNGVAQDIGTYFYFLRYRCGTEDTFEQKGEVTLIR